LEERRKYSRWKIAQRQAKVKHKNASAEVPLIDLSSGGMKIVSNEDIPVGSKIVGEFRVIPQSAPYFVQGSVTWTKSIPEHKFEIGIEFNKINTIPLT
jgi:hypothetical protein